MAAAGPIVAVVMVAVALAAAAWAAAAAGNSTPVQAVSSARRPREAAAVAAVRSVASSRPDGAAARRATSDPLARSVGVPSGHPAARADTRGGSNYAQACGLTPGRGVNTRTIFFAESRFPPSCKFGVQVVSRWCPGDAAPRPPLLPNRTRHRSSQPPSAGRPCQGLRRVPGERSEAGGIALRSRRSGRVLRAWTLPTRHGCGT